MKLTRRTSGERGTAIVFVMALLAVMCVFMTCTARAIYSVKRELKLIEKKQLQHWEKTSVSAGVPK